MIKLDKLVSKTTHICTYLSPDLNQVVRINHFSLTRGKLLDYALVHRVETFYACVILYQSEMGIIMN